MPCRIFTEKLKLMSSLFNIIATMGFLIQVTSRPLCVGPTLTQCSAEPKGGALFNLHGGRLEVFFEITNFGQTACNNKFTSRSVLYK